MPIYSNMPEGFYPRPSDVNAPLRSGIGIGPRGPKGHSITAEVIDTDPYGYFRVQFKDAETDEVLVTTPNLDVGSRIFVTIERVQLNNSAIGTRHVVSASDLTPLQVSSDRGAVRAGDIVIFNVTISNSTFLNVDTFGIGVVNSVDNIDANGRFTTSNMVHFCVTNVFTAAIRNGAIKGNMLDNNSVSTSKIMNGAVTNLKLGDNAISTSKIQNGAVTPEKLGNGAIIVPAPKIADPPEWDITRSYDELIIVTYNGNSYTSRQYVPIGIDINNTDFWASTGNYNAQVEQYHEEVEQVSEELLLKPFIFDSVEAMRACTKLFEGAICHTNGFHSSGDGGAAWYVVTTTGTDNGIDVIECGSSLYANYIQTDTLVDVRRFGAIPDGVTDSIDQFTVALSYMTRCEKTLFVDGDEEGYYISRELIISNLSSAEIIFNSPIVYNGTGPALILSNIDKSTLKLAAKGYNYDPLLPGSIGIRFINIHDSNINIYMVSCFETGIEVMGDNAGCSYNHFTLGKIINTRYGLKLTSLNNGWVNENLWYGGRFFCSSNTSYKPQYEGIRLEAYSCNNNVFIKPCFEGASTGINIVNGRNNTFLGCRAENTTTVMTGDSCLYNTILVGYGNTTTSALSSIDNTVNLSYNTFAHANMFMIYDSKNIQSRLISDSTHAYIDEYLTSINYYNKNPQQIEGSYSGDDFLVSSRIGVLVDTSVSKKLTIVGSTKITSNVFRAYIVPFDSDGNVISGTVKNPYIFWNESAQAFIAGAQSQNIPYIIELPENCVYAFVGFNCSNACITNLKIYGFIPSSFSNKEPTIALMTNKIPRGLTSIPTSQNPAGTICPKSNVGNSGAYGWISLGNGTWRELS